jgi:S1-C subfamily serine protease
MDEYQEPRQPSGQPDQGGAGYDQYGATGPEGGTPPGQPVTPYQPAGYQTQQYAPVPAAPRGSGRNGGLRKHVVTAVVAGVISALLVLLAVPAIFGVNPYDLVRGKVKRVVVQEKTQNGKTVTVISPKEGTMSVTAVAKQVIPSIVNIDIRTAPQQTPFFTTESSEGTGSGVIYSKDGYIITNNHVVEDAQDITVTLASGESTKGKTVGTDPDNDIAVVKIDKSGLPALQVGNSDSLAVGQLAVAVGSPFGFEQTVTSGIVSALNRSVSAGSETTGQTSVLTDLIQTDAAINPGNSGGALVDGQGRLIGINTVIASSGGGSEGVGFAIPINTARSVADALISGKTVSHPYIGIYGQTVSQSIANRYNLPVNTGAYVTNVVQGGPADKAGIKTGDIIVEVNGEAVKSMDDVVGEVRKLQVGDKVNVTYYSGKDKKTTQVTLAEKPSSVQ